MTTPSHSGYRGDPRNSTRRLRLVATLVVTVCLCGLGASSAHSHKQETVEVPFQLEQHQVMVDATLNGRGPYRLHLDTFVSPSAVDLTVAEGLGLETGPTAGNVAGLGTRNIPYRRTSIDRVSLGELGVSNVATIVWDSSHLEIGGRPLQGTLGASYFEKVWIQIDYPGRTLRLAANDDRTSPPSGCPENSQRVRADFSTGAPRLHDVRVEGQSVTAYLDTGASGGLHLPLRIARELGFSKRLENAEIRKARGARGEFKVRKTSARSVSIDGAHATEVVTLISEQARNVLIGNRFLEHFVLTVDWQGGLLCLGSTSAPTLG